MVMVRVTLLLDLLLYPRDKSIFITTKPTKLKSVELHLLSLVATYSLTGKCYAQFLLTRTDAQCIEILMGIFGNVWEYVL